jgi:hypothetical protein
MEQKRTLGGDEANGHENSVPGIYHHTSFNSRMRKKQKNRSALRKDILPSSCCELGLQMQKMLKITYSADSGKKSSNSRLTLIRPLAIPDIFIAKPTPPLKSYRTGKVWSRKRPHEPKKCDSRTVAKSRSDSNLLKHQLSHRFPKRRHSYVEHDLQSAEKISSPLISSSTNLHSPKHLKQMLINPLACREVPRVVPCINCLKEVGYVSHMTQNRLLIDRNLSSLLNDFLQTSGFQHIIFC